MLALAALGTCTPLAANMVTQSGINVRRVGEGNETWILMHPFSGSGRFWEPRAAALATGYKVQVHSPDLPSHGLSRIVQRFSYDAAADAIGQSIGTHRTNTALIVGASSGALVAMKLAASWGKPVVAIGGWLAFSTKNIENMYQQSRELPAAAAQFADAFLEQGARQRLRSNGISATLQIMARHHC